MGLGGLNSLPDGGAEELYARPADDRPQHADQEGPDLERHVQPLLDPDDSLPYAILAPESLFPSIYSIEQDFGEGFGGTHCFILTES